MPRGKKTVGEVKEAANKATKTETKAKAKSKKSVLGSVPEIKIPDPQPSIVDEIVWCSKRSCQTAKLDYKDVGVNLSHHNKHHSRKNDYYTITFAFRNNMSNVFGKENVYIQFGAIKNRIYFKVADPKIGYKLNSKSGLTSYVQATCSDEMKAVYEEFCPGEYHLKYDDFQELYYIEKEK
jgi:hypothetical protein